MKLLCVDSNMNACPTCRHASFVVFTSEYNIYLTDHDGDVVDVRELDNSADGICTNCGKRYKMIKTANGFMPLTTLREILLKDIISDSIIPDYQEYLTIENPMQKG